MRLPGFEGLDRGGESQPDRIDLRGTVGYVVSDLRGRYVGIVECALYGGAPDLPDALAVKAKGLARHRRLVPLAAIEQIDPARRLIGLRIDRSTIRTFL